MMRHFISASAVCLLALAVCGPVAVLAAAPPTDAAASPGQAGPHAAKRHFPGDNGGQKGPPQPIDITADDGLEWHQKERLYVAHGHASATRGNVTLYGDRITAYERDVAPAATTAAAKASPAGPGTGNTEIWRIVADGHVHLVNRRADGKIQEAFGDHGVYDLDRQLSVLTGKNLRGQSEDSLITARDSLEYWQGQNLAIARGDAMAYDRANQRKVFAGTLVAIFKDDENGQQKLDHAEADGHVVIITPDDYATGDHGRYNPDDDKAWLTGHVHVTHGKSQMNGDMAEMDFGSDLDRMSKDPDGHSWSQNRVYGLLVPESQPKKAATSPPPAQAANSITAAQATASTTPAQTGGAP